VGTPVEIASTVAGEPQPDHPAVLRSERPDPEVRRLMRQLNLWPPSPLAGPHAVADARRDWQLTVKAFASRPPVGRVSEHAIPGPSGQLKIRIYTPRSGRRPRALLAYFHGGGFIMGDLYTAGSMARALAARTDAIVAAVRYRLAPEHSLEDARDDCLAAVEWLAQHAVELGADEDRLGVAGDSAGGLLAAAISVECARRGGPRLAVQVLVYPATDLLSDNASNREDPGGGLLTPGRIEWMRSEISKETDLSDPRLSPLRAPDLRGVAPAVIVTAGYDPIRDEGLAYAARLREADVPVHSLHYPGQMHGFASFDRVLQGAWDAMHRIGSAVRATGDPPGFHWGACAEPPPRPFGPTPWLDPRQRLNETIATGLAGREQIRRWLRY
jgi:acetyl esterase